MPASFLLINTGEILSFGPLAAQMGPPKLIKPEHLGQIPPNTAGWIWVQDGKICQVGNGPQPTAAASLPRIDACGRFVMPGLVDSHAHPIFAGARHQEFAMRLNGASYQEIAAAGGGIRSSMQKTRAASDESLLAALEQQLQRWLRLGVTSLEAKSGYGLSTDSELRLLRLLQQAKRTATQQISVTCLALHASSPEYKSLAEYSRACVEQLLPQVARESLADAADAFIEAGYFSVADVAPYAECARNLGLRLRLHADEFSDAGAAQAAADWGAASADHLQFASEAGIAAMARANVTATILPGTSLYTKIPFANGRRFADAGCAVAIATDFNPGSCLIDNLAMLASVAAIHCGLRPAEALAGVTFVPACSLGWKGQKGALAPGYDADFLLYDLAGSDAWLADFGRTAPAQVWVRGVSV